jgi:hypothetical protein
MPVTVPLTPEEQSTLLAHAKAQGVSVDSLLRQAVLQIISQAPTPQPQLSGEELERAFEELAELIPENVPAMPDESLRRENI